MPPLPPKNSTLKIQGIAQWKKAFPLYDNLDTRYYKKFVSVRGVPVASSGRASNAGLLETAKWVEHMFSLVPKSVIDALKSKQIKLTMMAETEVTTDVPEHAYLKYDTVTDWDERARGLGANEFTRTASCAEENVLCRATDPYLGE